MVRKASLATIDSIRVSVTQAGKRSQLSHYDENNQYDDSKRLLVTEPDLVGSEPSCVSAKQGGAPPQALKEQFGAYTAILMG